MIEHHNYSLSYSKMGLYETSVIVGAGFAFGVITMGLLFVIGVKLCLML